MSNRRCRGHADDKGGPMKHIVSPNNTHSPPFLWQVLLPYHPLHIQSVCVCVCVCPACPARGPSTTSHTTPPQRHYSHCSHSPPPPPFLFLLVAVHSPVIGLELNIIQQDHNMTEPTILHQLWRDCLHIVPIPRLLVPLEVTLGEPRVGGEERRQDIVIHQNHTFDVYMGPLCTGNCVHVAFQDVSRLFIFKRDSCGEKDTKK